MKPSHTIAKAFSVYWGQRRPNGIIVPLGVFFIFPLGNIRQDTASSFSKTKIYRRSLT